MWRIWAALGLLQPDGHGGVQRSPEFIQIDPSEQANANYALGGTMAKAYATDKLDVPWLAHLSIAERAGYVIEFEGNRKPDYLGYSNNSRDLVIAEAKGRQVVRRALKDDLDGKLQANGVKSVNGDKPKKRYGILAEARGGESVTLYAVDPPEAVQVDFNMAQWMRDYYGFVRTLVRECEDDPPPGDEQHWGRIDLRVPKPVSDWLDRERGLEAWPAVERKVMMEAEEYRRERPATVLSDLLVMQAREPVRD